MARKPKHGLSKSPEYRAWIDMKTRCYHKNNKRYKDYGGRGIIVCQEWLESFENFYKDLGPKPSKEYSLERRDNNGNYEPDNCYWATWPEQYSNRRLNYNITFNNKTQTLTEWSKELNMNTLTLSGRIHKQKWSVEKAFTTPIKGKKCQQLEQ